MSKKELAKKARLELLNGKRPDGSLCDCGCMHINGVCPNCGKMRGSK